MDMSMLCFFGLKLTLISVTRRELPAYFAA